MPLTIIINKIILSGAKIRFKLKKEGIDSLPKSIIDNINYWKMFPFFDIGKETKAVISQIELEGPFKDIKSLYEEIKINVITQLSTEIVIKVLHPSNNEIKDNMKNIMIGFDSSKLIHNMKNIMIGFDSSKLIHKINVENSLRIKNKRMFIGKNKFFKKYDKNFAIVEQAIKNMGNFNEKFFIDFFSNFNDEKSLLIFFEDCFVYSNENGQNIKIIYYKNLKEIKNEKIGKKFYIYCKYINEEKEDKDFSIEFKNGNFSENIYKLLNSFSNI